MRVEIWPRYEVLKVGQSLDLLLLKLDINGAPAHGIVLRTPKLTRFETLPVRSNPIMSKISPKDSLDVVSLDSELACDVNSTGGKGASLAKLGGMSKSFKVINKINLETDYFFKKFYGTLFFRNSRLHPGSS